MELIIGPPNSGKTREAITRLSDALSRQGAKALLIVPSASAQAVTMDRLQSFLRDHNIAFNKPYQVVKTFPGLYTDILTHTGRSLSVLKKVERDRLLRLTISELAEEKRLLYLGDIAGSEGLMRAVSSFIDELWRSGTDAEKFSRIAREREGKDRDLALIFARYSARLRSSNVTDAEGAGLEALRALDESTKKNPADRFSLVVADGFDFYTSIQVGLLSRLSLLGVETLATLTYEPGCAVHLWQEPTLKRFESAGAQVTELRSSPASEIERAAARLMRDDLQTDSSESAPVTVISAPDRAAEVRAAAREIKRLILENRLAPDDIAIVCRSLSLYSNHLQKIFRECSIPLAIDGSLALAENPAVISFMRLLALSHDSFPRRAVVDCLRSPFFNLSRFRIDEQAINLLDYASIAGNVTRAREQWTEALRAADAKTDEGRLEHIYEEDTDARKKRYANLAQSLDDFFDEVSLPDSGTVRWFAQRAIRLLEEFDVENRAGDENREAIKSLRALIEDVGNASESSEDISQPVFYAELERSVASGLIERDFIPSSILAQEAHNLRPRRYRAVFLLGLIEGEFPARATERFPYTLIEREQLRALSIDLTETISDAGADLTQFYKAMAAATERLYLSYARTDLAGGELLRSYLIDEVEACARARKIVIPQQAASFEQVPFDEIISLDELALITAREMRRADESQTESEETRAAQSLLEKEFPVWRAIQRGARVERDRLTGASGPFGGVMESADILREIERKFGAGHSWSASQINDYGVCPFRFFARHALRLKPADEPVEGFVASRLGNAYHKILEKTYERLSEKKIEVSMETAQLCADEAVGVAEVTLEEMVSKGEIRQSVFWEFEKAEIKRHVARLFFKEAEWNAERPARPIAFEKKFGLDDTQPLIIESDEGDIKICGVIDRIDQSEDGLVVIDYKTTRTPIKHSDAVEGRNLQLPIYLMAAGRALQPQARVTSGYYLHITSRKKGAELPRSEDESIDSVTAHAEEKIRQHTKQARCGKFPVRPNNDRCYTNCEYECMCRIWSLRFEI
ncbi:MAG: PD-(D/E)XK nuclease family protein [Acidobacteriota bacterium]